MKLIVGIMRLLVAYSFLNLFVSAISYSFSKSVHSNDAEQYIIFISGLSLLGLIYVLIPRIAKVFFVNDQNPSLVINISEKINIYGIAIKLMGLYLLFSNLSGFLRSVFIMLAYKNTKYIESILSQEYWNSVTTLIVSTVMMLFGYWMIAHTKRFLFIFKLENDEISKEN